MFLTQEHKFKGKFRATLLSVLHHREGDVEGLPQMSVESGLILRSGVCFSSFGLYSIVILMVNDCVCTGSITVAFPLMRVKLP